MGKDLGKIYKEVLNEQERQHKLKLASQQAMIDLANKKQSWAERHPFIMLLIGVVLGFLLNYILELLKLYHILGL